MSVMPALGRQRPKERDLVSKNETKTKTNSERAYFFLYVLKYI